MLALVKVHRGLRRRRRHQIGQPWKITESMERILLWGLRRFRVVLYFNARFPRSHMSVTLIGKLDFNSTNFLRLLSVTTHSTWSKRQFVQGEPFSTTSHRTLRARQQQQAFEARLLTGRLWPESPAVEAFLFPDSVSVMLCYCVRGRMGDIRVI